ncbi:MAG TPA: oligoendopeptidase F [Anaerolineae bacterium]|nr:oligoendopeptidase F [Anaerolineae bacterium]
MSQTVPTRDEIDIQYTWDVDSIFPTITAWQNACQQLKDSFPQLKTYQGRLHEGPDIWAEWQTISEKAINLAEKIFVYAHSAYSVNTKDQDAAARFGQARTLYGQTGATISFAEPELLSIGLDTLRQWVKQNDKLAHYDQYLNQLEKRQPYIRSAEVEEILGLAQDAFSTATSTHGVLANSELHPTPATDADGNTYQITQGNIDSLITHPDRDVRRTAWQNYADAHLNFKSTMANLLITGVKQNVFKHRVRGYPSSVAAALESNFIPVEVFHNLIATFKKHLPTWHRYWRIRRQALGYDKLHVYDIKAPLGPMPTIKYTQAVDMIAAGMAPLGAEYVSILKKGSLDNRWVDIYPNQGKRMGAFSSGVHGTHPFILMSYTDDLFSLSTLAHELGHSLHSYYTWQTQPYIYADYTLFAAEVASNFNQALVRAHLLETNDDPQFQIAVIEEAMSNFHRYFFLMPTLARFELAIHETVEQGGALNADSLTNMLADLFKEGYGDEVEFDKDRIGITWAIFHTHLYSNFYVYQYATGIAGAHALAKRILDGEPGAVDDYLGFLKAGNAHFPLDALKQAGVDLTTPDPVEAGFATLSAMIDKLEELVAQRTTA